MKITDKNLELLKKHMESFSIIPGWDEHVLKKINWEETQYPALFTPLGIIGVIFDDVKINITISSRSIEISFYFMSEEVGRIKKTMEME